MPRPRAQIETALAKKGFELHETHHRYYRLVVGGRYTGLQTRVSTGSSYKDYGDSLLAEMAKQLKLKKAELNDLLDCPMDRAKYLARLLEQGVLEAAEVEADERR